MRSTIKSNYRVEVYPKTTVYGIRVAEEKDVCEAMVAEIRRHVNDVHHVGVVHDTEQVCSHCGCHWYEDGDLYNGGCCKADQTAFDELTGNNTTNNQTHQP